MTANYRAVKVIDVIGSDEIYYFSALPEFGQLRQHACREKPTERVSFHLTLAN